MILIDTHTHLYASEFDQDRKQVVLNAIEAGVELLFLPNIDSSTIEPMLELVAQFPENCFPMMGLHPTSVKENYQQELDVVEMQLNQKKFIAIGEFGLDLYWDKTFLNEQLIVLKQHFDWAKQFNLPVVIHLREAFDEMKAFLDATDLNGIRGVFHCFTGSLDEAQYLVSKGFMLGIGGVLTYKKTDLPEVVKAIGIEHLILETDSPYLSPVPKRGKRNESANTLFVAQKLADTLEISLDLLATITTKNARTLFGL